MRLVIVGLGKVGGPLAQYMQSLGHDVIGLDTNHSAVNAAPQEVSATHEPERAYDGAESAILIVPTPQVGDRLSSDYVRKAGEEARAFLPSSAPIFIASTLDPRDASDVCREISADAVPVFIRLGNVLKDLQTQGFLLVGTHRKDPEAVVKEARSVWGVVHDWLEQRPVFVSDPTTIACAKLAINASLSMKIAWANDVAERARRFGADPDTVLKVVRSDPRIGSACLNEGFLPGGPCLPRDLDVWMSAQGRGMAEAVLVCHRATRARVLANIMETINAKPVKTVLVIGLTYKEGGLDWTNALGMDAVRECAKAGYQVYAYDREGTPEAMIEEAGGQRVGGGASFSAFDAIIVGFPGYPVDIAEKARDNSRGLTVINIWR